MLLDIDTIMRRARAIRWTAKELAAASGAAQSTVSRFVTRKSGRTDTLDRLHQAVVEEERRLLDHLRSLHGEAA